MASRQHGPPTRPAIGAKSHMELLCRYSVHRHTSLQGAALCPGMTGPVPRELHVHMLLSGGCQQAASSVSLYPSGLRPGGRGQLGGARLDYTSWLVSPRVDYTPGWIRPYRVGWVGYTLHISWWVRPQVGYNPGGPHAPQMSGLQLGCRVAHVPSTGSLRICGPS